MLTYIRFKSLIKSLRRRCRVSREISKVFRHVKVHGVQPGPELFCLPSGLATFTRFALRSALRFTIGTFNSPAPRLSSFALVCHQVFKLLCCGVRTYFKMSCMCVCVFRSMGQEVICTVREADYEIASYAHCHGSMGILGQDSDFIIFNRSIRYLLVIL